MNQTLEIVDALHTHHRLTITPDRITIKLLPGAEQTERAEVIEFCTWVVARFQAGTVAWRGRVRRNDRNGWAVTLENDRRTAQKTLQSEPA